MRLSYIFLALTHRVAFGESLLADVQAPFGLQGINHYIFYIPRIRRIGGCYGFYVEAARNGVNAITKKPRYGLFSNLVYTLVVIVSWPD